MVRPKHDPGATELRLLAELRLQRDLTAQADSRKRELIREARAEGATWEALAEASGWGTTTIGRILGQEASRSS